MDGFALASLLDVVEQLGEERTRAILSRFLCPLNEDVQYFLHSRAIEFAKQGIAPTQLVFASYRGHLELVGYFTLTTKVLSVEKNKISKTLGKRIAKFGTLDRERSAYIIPAPLIAQLGKNYRDGIDTLITGDELLSFAVEKVATIQQAVGGKVVYLECEDQPRLLEFYRRNGFTPFGKRTLDREERERIPGHELIQLLRIIR